MPQVGIFLSCEGSNKEATTSPFQWTPTKLSAQGLIHLALDSGYATEIIETHNLFERDLSRYGAIVIGTTSWIDNETRDKLLEYTEMGGNLIIASPKTAKLFGFGVSEPTEKLIHICDGEALAPMMVYAADLATVKGSEICGTYYLDNYMENGPYTAAYVTKMGKGKVAVTCFDFGRGYSKNKTTCAKNFFKNIMKKTFTKPAVTVEGSSLVELDITEKDNMMYIHLLNYGGPHEVANIRSYSEIPPLGPLTVKIADYIKPKSVTIEPEHKTWKGNPNRIRIEKLDIHTVIAVEL